MVELLMALGLSMDAFAVSVCKGLSMKQATVKSGLICGTWFGSFQALMTFLGFCLATLFAEAIREFDHWVAFGLLCIIGINLLKEAFGQEESCDCSLSFKTMFVLAVATSIDAMAAGISLVAEQNANITLAIVLIGVITFLMSWLGVKIGSVFGNRFEKKAQIAGGVILILLGVKILLEHLGVLHL